MNSSVELVGLNPGSWNLLTMNFLHLDSILIYTLVPTMSFGILGVGTNILNIIVFVKMGLQETTTISMLALAVSDLSSCLLAAWVVLCYIPAFRDMPNLPFVSTEVSNTVGGSMRVYLTRTGGMITAYITLERCLCVVAPLKVKTVITLSVTRAVVIIIYAITVLPSIAYYFWDTLEWKFYPHLNRSLLGIVSRDNPTVTLVNQLNGFVCGFGYLFFSSLIIFMCTIFLIVALTRSSKWRESFNTKDKDASSEKKPTSSASSSNARELRLIKMVATIASIFILGMLPGMSVLCGTAILPDDFSLRGQYAAFYIFTSSLATVTETINSSINFFVYYTMGTKFKTTLNQTIGLAPKETRGVQKKIIK